MGGGTGSGLGSYLLKRIKEDFQWVTIVNYLVLPLLSGEVTLQFYNTILSLSVIYQNSDVIFLLRNDDANLVCESMSNKKAVSFDEINHILSLKIAVSLLNLGKISIINTKTFASQKLPDSYSTSLCRKMKEKRSKSFQNLLIDSLDKQEKINLIKVLKNRIIKVNSYKLLGIRFFPMIGHLSKEFEANNWRGLINRSFRSLLSFST